VEYEHCAADIRNYDSVTYQFPTISAAILYAVAYVQIFVHSPNANSALPKWMPVLFWALAALLLASLTMGMFKHRRFQKSRVDALSDIVKQLRSLGGAMYEVPLTTSQIRDRWKSDIARSARYTRSWLFRWKAAYCLMGAMFFSFVVAFLMFIHELAALCHS
jgi:hypothetical protein